MAQTVNIYTKVSVGEIYLRKIASMSGFLLYLFLGLLGFFSGNSSLEFDYKTAPMWQILALNFITITALSLIILIIYAWFLA